jgi:ABC-type arginine transport system ATPase subunit
MEEKDSDYFFGRDDKTVEVIRALEATPDKLPILLGNSGVGKSSHLRTTDMLKCPKHGDIGPPSELLDQTLQRQIGNALTEALKKGDH